MTFIANLISSATSREIGFRSLANNLLTRPFCYIFFSFNFNSSYFIRAMLLYKKEVEREKKR